VYGSPCRLPKDVCGRPGAMRKPACVGEGERKATPSSTKHRAFVWCQNLKPYGILACGDVQCYRNQLEHTKRSAKVFSRTVQLNILASRAASCIQRCSAKGFSRTVRLNILASRETSSAQRQSMSSSAFSRSLDSGRLRDERHNFHVTFAASKYYHSNDMSVTEGINIDRIESQTHWTARFQSS